MTWLVSILTLLCIVLACMVIECDWRRDQEKDKRLDAEREAERYKAMVERLKLFKE